MGTPNNICVLAGVREEPLKVISTDGGPVLHMLRADAPWFKGFGEIYFSEVLPGAVKGWKRHKAQTQCFAAPVGLIRLKVYDSRPNSPSFGQSAEYQLGRPDRYKLLILPPGLWYAFGNAGHGPALLANCADLPHDPCESEKLPLDSPEMPCWWIL